MGLRFQKRIRVLPGVRVNVGLGGVSTSLGVRGASVTVGKRGTYANVGAPGTGLSYRTRIDKSDGDRPSSRAAGAVAGPTAGDMPVRLKLHDNGAVEVLDENGGQLPPRAVRAVREQQGEAIGAWLQERCDAINDELTAISDVHLQCPGPDEEPKYRAARFAVESPPEPVARTPGFFEGLLLRVRNRIRAENAAARSTWERKMRAWRERKASFEREERKRERLFRAARTGSADEMSEFFRHRIEELAWPRETLIDYQIEQSGNVMYVDVDLPEVEDMPKRQASIPSRGLRLSIKAVSDARNRRNYARHIHGVLFRVIGEAFASFPRMRQVVGSGFSQRLDRATGTIADEYLISVSVDRTGWRRIDFSALDRVDPVAALSQFNLRRRMSRTGTLAAIEPFTTSSAI